MVNLIVQDQEQIIPVKQPTARARIWAVLPWVVFGVACVLFVVGQIVLYERGINADMAADLLLAKILSEGRGFIVTNQWFYSTELHFLHTQLVFTPLFWLCDDWMVVQIVGVTILNALLVLSFYFLLRSLKIQKLFPWLGTFLLLPLGYQFAHFVSFSVSYVTYLTVGMTIIALIIYAMRAKTVKKRNWLVAGSAVLTFLNSLGGSRQFLTIGATLLATALVWMLLYRGRDYRKTNQKLFWICLINFAMALAGLVVNIALSFCLVLNPNYFAKNGDKFLIDFRALGLWGYIKRIISFIYVFGAVNSEVFDFSVIMMDILGFIYLLFFIYCTISILKNRGEYSLGEVFLTTFCIVGFGIILSLVTVTNLEFYERFYLTSSIYALPVCAIYLTHDSRIYFYFRNTAVGLRKILCYISWGLVLTLSLFTYINFYFFRGYVWLNIDEIDEVKAITYSLMDAGYTQGYTDFHFANAIVQLSNGQLEIWQLGNYIIPNMKENSYNWLQETKHAEQPPEGKFFVSMPLKNYIASDINLFYVVFKADAQCFYESESFAVFVFDNYEEMTNILQKLYKYN